METGEEERKERRVAVEDVSFTVKFLFLLGSFLILLSLMALIASVIEYNRIFICIALGTATVSVVIFTALHKCMFD